MSYDIFYVPLAVINDKKELADEDGYSVFSPYEEFKEYEGSYFSINFQKKSEDGKYNFREYFYLPDLAGHTTNYLAKFFEELLLDFAKENIYPNIPIEKDEESKDINVFVYHIKRLWDECLENKNCVMMLDYPHPLRYENEKHLLND